MAVVHDFVSRIHPVSVRSEPYSLLRELSNLALPVKFAAAAAAHHTERGDLSVLL